MSYYEFMTSGRKRARNAERRTGRPYGPPEQGLDETNEIYLRHEGITQGLISRVQGGETFLEVDPYGTAPLCAVAGIAATTASANFNVLVEPDNDDTDIGYITPAIQAIDNVFLVPVLGLHPDTPCTVSVYNTTDPFSNPLVEFNVSAAALPPSDEELDDRPGQEPGENQGGRPIITRTGGNNDDTSIDLMFTSLFGRCNCAFDKDGTYRWYITNELPTYNYYRRPSNGNFVASNQADELGIWEFNMVGRVLGVYNTVNRIHHSLIELPADFIEGVPANSILYPCEYTENVRPAEDNPEGIYTTEDVISLIDLDNNAQEVYYWDIRNVLDVERQPVPRWDLDADDLDWLHMNQVYRDSKKGHLVFSARHQGVFGIDFVTGELLFALSSHQDWTKDEQISKLLTPVEDIYTNPTPLYDLSDPVDIDDANKNFWPWGQHNVTEVTSEDPNVIEFTVFNNGNYRTRGANFPDGALYPNENRSEFIHYRIDLVNLTVDRPFVYGDENGLGQDGGYDGRGYSSLVSAGHQLSNGNYVVAFGANVADGNDLALTVQPGVTDIVYDPASGFTEDGTAQGVTIIHEFDQNRQLIHEYEIASGTYKSDDFQGGGYRLDCTAFTIDKMPIMPPNYQP